MSYIYIYFIPTYDTLTRIDVKSKSGHIFILKILQSAPTYVVQYLEV